MERVAKIQQSPSENGLNTHQDQFMNTPGSGCTLLSGKIPRAFENVEGWPKRRRPITIDRPGEFTVILSVAGDIVLGGAFTWEQAFTEHTMESEQFSNRAYCFSNIYELERLTRPSSLSVEWMDL